LGLRRNRWRREQARERVLAGQRGNMRHGCGLRWKIGWGRTWLLTHAKKLIVKEFVFMEDNMPTYVNLTSKRV